jgi:hypothetical protein
MVMSRTAIYRFVLVFTIFAFMDLTGSLFSTTFGVIVKYIYTLTLLGFIFTYLVIGRSIVINSVAPLLALFFFLITTVVFLFNLVAYGYKLSYASAFTSCLVFAAAAFIPQTGLSIDIDRVLRQILFLLFVCTVLYLFEIIFKSTSFGQSHSYITDPQFGKTLLSIVGLCLAILMRQRGLTWLFLIGIVAALILRPSSTLVLAFAICLPLTALLRYRALLFSRIFAYGFLALAAAAPIILYVFHDEVGDAIGAMEMTVKSDALGANPNTQFRMLVITLALRQLEGAAILYGSGLDGNTSVFVGRELPQWVDETGSRVVTIHSDFVIVLTQAGIIGYSMFITFFYFILHVRFRSLGHTARLHAGLYNMLSISIVAVVCLMAYSMVNPNLQYYYISPPIWLLLLVSELAARATVSSGGPDRVKATVRNARLSRRMGATTGSQVENPSSP